MSHFSQLALNASADRFIIKVWFRINNWNYTMTCCVLFHNMPQGTGWGGMQKSKSYLFFSYFCYCFCLFFFRQFHQPTALIKTYYVYIFILKLLFSSWFVIKLIIRHNSCYAFSLGWTGNVKANMFITIMMSAVSTVSWVCLQIKSPKIAAELSVRWWNLREVFSDRKWWQEKTQHEYFI